LKTAVSIKSLVDVDEAKISADLLGWKLSLLIKVKRG
jgi:hypothetical protein